ncbi:MAG: S8/S53 family peptidase [Chloroflexi bacterium]|nr:S8/S53 family peptidase [Chloroflexota bacterium]
MPEIPADYQPLESSRRVPRRGARLVGPADPAERLSVTIRLRRRPDAPPLPDVAALAQSPTGQRAYLSREDFAARYGADPADLDRVVAFARSHGLQVEETSVARRSVRASGTVEQMSRAFAVDLGRYEAPDETYRGRDGHVHLPADLIAVVEGVFGLDNRRMARPLFVKSKTPEQSATPAQAITPLTPPQVAKLYNFPTPANATGQTIGVLEFGGGYQPSDIHAFFSGLGLATPTLTAVGVDGATNAPGSDADGEVVLDIDVAGAVAPGAKIVAYFAPWTEQGWVDVVTTAVHDTTNAPSVLSISWGWAELQEILGLLWSPAAVHAVSTTFQEAALLGVSVLVASGDDGTNCQIGDGKAHVLYPAADPWVTTCGGTTIENVSGSTFKEATWNDNGVTGGGISDIFQLPDWQSGAGVPKSINDGHVGRGVPDVAGNADPDSGYMLVLNGSPYGPIGGTSATAPLYAGLVALLNATLGEPAGYLNYNLYRFAGPYVYRDIADGGSNSAEGSPGYTAGAGWDACTGFGSINGSNLLMALRGLGLAPALAVFKGKLYMAWKGVERDESIWWTTFDGTHWAPQQQVPGVWTSDGPSLAVFNGKLYMAWKGMYGDQRIWWTTFDGSHWAPQQQVPGVWTSVGPALAVFGGKLYMAWKGMDGDQRIWWTTFDGTHWTAQQLVPGVWTSVGPALAVFKGKLYMIWKGMDGDQRIWWTSFDGTHWAAQQSIAGVGTTHGPSLAVFNGALYAAWKGIFGDQGIYVSHFDGTHWAAQQHVAGIATSLGPELAVFNRKLYMTWKGMLGDERIWWTTFDGAHWATQQQVPGVWTSPDLAKAAAGEAGTL